MDNGEDAKHGWIFLLPDPSILDKSNTLHALGASVDVQGVGDITTRSKDQQRVADVYSFQHVGEQLTNMCGIAGIAGSADEYLVERMLAVTRHRGPNDSGTYANRHHRSGSQVTLGNNRLSIIDLSTAGHQPMCNEDGSVWIAYNGEVFNFQELREELLADGHEFKSRTDTEVLVHLYEKCGRDMVARLNGMFAFALWDANSEQLLIARDRTGIKPLYYTQAGGKL